MNDENKEYKDGLYNFSPLDAFDQALLVDVPVLLEPVSNDTQPWRHKR